MNTAKNEPKRDQWGRYMLPDPRRPELKPRAWTRCTTVSGVLSDRYNLEQWAQRMVALGLAKRPDLLALVKTYHPTRDKQRLNKLVKQALEAGNEEQRANIGTAIHAATEALDNGEPVELQAPYDADVLAYRDGLKAAGIEILEGWIERIVLAPELEIAGTLDRVVTRSGWPLPRIADIKTGARVDYSELEHAVQQSIYANATHVWNPDTEELEAMPQIDREIALIIHIPAGEARCDIYELDIERGFQAATTALEVRAWRRTKGLSRPLKQEEAR